MNAGKLIRARLAALLGGAVPAGQVRRDAASVIATASSLAAVWSALGWYLDGLSHGHYLHIGLMMSVIFAISRDFHFHSLRTSMVRALRTSVLSLPTIALAGYLRSDYVTTMAAVSSSPELLAIYGPDLMGLMTNKAVGYGGFFATAGVVIRLSFWKDLEDVLYSRLVLPEFRTRCCSECGHALDQGDTPFLHLFLSKSMRDRLDAATQRLRDGSRSSNKTD